MQSHWTERSTEDFLYFIFSNVLLQIENKAADLGLSYKDIANKCGKTEAFIFQSLDNPGILSIEDVIRLARSVGMKISIIAYDDDDSINEHGPICSDVFIDCWETCEAPRTLENARPYW